MARAIVNLDKLVAAHAALQVAVMRWRTHCR
jgi:hypothetical protein